MNLGSCRSGDDILLWYLAAPVCGVYLDRKDSFFFFFLYLSMTTLQEVYTSSQDLSQQAPRLSQSSIVLCFAIDLLSFVTTNRTDSNWQPADLQKCFFTYRTGRISTGEDFLWLFGSVARQESSSCCAFLSLLFGRRFLALTHSSSGSESSGQCLWH